MLTPLTRRGLVARMRAVWSSVPLALRLYVGLMALVVGIGTLWLAARIHRRESAIREIEQVGGRVERRPGAPAWLRSWPVDNCIDAAFEEVKTIEFFPHHLNLAGYLAIIENYQPLFEDQQPNDKTLESIAKLGSVEAVTLEDSRVTEAGAANLARLKNLRGLSLEGTTVTDIGIRKLRGLVGLTSLSLSRVEVTDVGLKSLENMSGLEGLTLCGTQISDAGVETIRRFQKLSRLDLSRTRITDAGLLRLDVLKNLHTLYLDTTQITDRGLAVLDQLPRLTVLGATASAH